MKTGIELIAKERQEQIEKHGRDANHDNEHSEGQLIYAATYAINPVEHNELVEQGYGGWEDYEENIRNKSSVIDRLIVAGALIAAEIDRLQRLTQPQ